VDTTKINPPKKKCVLSSGRELASVKLKLGVVSVEIHGTPTKKNVDRAWDLLSGMEKHVRENYWKSPQKGKENEYR